MPQEVITPPRSVPSRRILWGGGIGILVLLVVAVLERSWFLCTYVPVWALLYLGRWWFPTVRVSAQEIRIPGRSKAERRLSWVDLDAVNAPSRFDTTTSLRMLDGRTVALPGIPADRAADVARLADKPLQARPVTVTVARPPTFTVRRSEAQHEADLARRAAALKERGQQLSSQLQKPTT
jgi:hypothetical protein